MANDVVPIQTTRPYLVNSRSTIGGPTVQFFHDNDPEINGPSGMVYRANKDILYPISITNPFPVTSGLVST